MFEEQVLHDSLHLAEALAEGHRGPGESLDEAGLVLLPEQPEDKALLAGVDDSVRPETQHEACLNYACANL